jgi:hypothetical protein
MRGALIARFSRAVLIACLVVSAAMTAVNAQEQTFNLTIKNNQFEPSTLNVPSGAKFKLVLHNAGSKSVEFESTELNREKVVTAGSSVVISIGPLAAGTYGFFDDFNRSTRGQMVAK